MCEIIRFVRDVTSHKLSVIRDDGLYRHLRFSRQNTRAYSFDIVTWPGYLTVTGDMGTWTFSRITDMFEFFTDKHFGVRDSFQINPGYWSEKFEAGTGGGRYDTPCYEFDGRAFDKGLQEWLASYLEGCDDEEDAETAKEVVRELTGNGFRRESDAYHALNDAYFPHNVSSYDISEGMGSNMTHSHHYLWICYAIVWGIERYNNQKLVARAMDTFLAFLPAHAAVREALKP
ncbi:hypothetical protein [Erwinia sp. Leaf53]|uniref:hypothetical protein n=1 Tax=Erwinia sp. Leaf53 TaxID=1736225 RepID=UPI0006F942C8|nr:hypothetical protein [Erwinia sp. Leaf53]KQN63661.1 hypothetical protein ASF13_18980 [Erwinia sp. Leaf53]